MGTTTFLGQQMEMAEPRDIEVAAISPQRLSSLIGTSRLNNLVHAAEQARRQWAEAGCGTSAYVGGWWCRRDAAHPRRATPGLWVLTDGW